jgi:hypothetical protein
MWKRFNRWIWGPLGHIFRVRTIAQLLDSWRHSPWWGKVAAVVTAALLGIWQWLTHRTAPESIALALVTFAAISIIWAFAIFSKRTREGGYERVSAEWPTDLRSELELRRAKRNDGVILFLENTTDRTLKGCGVTVAMLSRFYEEMHDFIRPHEFTTINLLEPQDLLPKQRSSEAYLVHHKPYYHSAPTLGNPASNPPRAVPEPGIWRAELHIFSVPDKAYAEDVFFQWQPEAKADFTPNPMPGDPK